MKLATYKWIVKLTIHGETFVPFSPGFKTKKEATEEADRWLAKGIDAEVINRNLYPLKEA